MSPRERRTRLVEEVRAELDRIEQVLHDLGDAATVLGPDCGAPARLAVAACLHAHYTGCEAVMTRLVRASGDLPRGRDWHQALLVVATAPLEGVRPPIVSSTTATSLLEFLQFRHFFRASYGVELDVGRLQELVEVLPDVHRGFTDDIESLLVAIERAAVDDDATAG